MAGIFKGREIDLSCATIVNLMPRTIKEYKPGLHPSEFIIPKGSNNKPGLLIVNSDIHYLINPDILSEAKEVQYLKVPVKALECAQSIITDYVGSLIAIELDIVPALFAVKGDFKNHEEVLERFPDEIEVYKKAQFNWFNALVRMADDTWSKTKSPVGISDLQREAGNALNLDRDWLSGLVESKKCRYCSAVADSIVCPNCHHVLDEAKYNAMKPVLAGVK